MQFTVHQDNAKKRTLGLLLLYAVCVLLLTIIAAGAIETGLSIMSAQDIPSSGYGTGYGAPAAGPGTSFWEAAATLIFSERFAMVFAGVTLFLTAVGTFQYSQMRSGGKSVAEAMHGRLVPPQTQQPQERRLLNIVEEMAIASGMPVPPVYVLDEPGINAFAAGHSLNDAVIGVTQGTLALLNREELQAVVAHEFSHIANGDMKLNLRFAALLAGLLCLADMSQSLLRGASWSRGSDQRDSKAAGVIMLVAMVLLVAGLLTAVLGRIVQAAINRQREYLADASAVQFTRSLALASALKKIGASTAGSQFTKVAAGEYGHLFFSPVSRNLFSTHPPLQQRILRIEPEWDGSFPALTATNHAASPQQHTEKSNTASYLHETAGTGFSHQPGALAESFPKQAAVQADTVENPHIKGYTPSNAPPHTVAGTSATGHAGVFTAQQRTEPLSAAQQAWVALGANASHLQLNDSPSATQPQEGFLSRLFTKTASGKSLDDMCKEPLDACTLMFALLLDDDPAVQARQLVHMKGAEDALACKKQLAGMVLKQKILLIEKSVPALKTLSSRQYNDLQKKLAQLIHADGLVSLQEWLLQQLIIYQVGAAYPASRQFVQKHATLIAAKQEIHALLASLARLATDESTVQHAFTAGLQEIHLPTTALPPKENYTALSKHLATLQQSAPSVREGVIKASMAIALYDKTIAPEEAAWLRAVSLCLGYPVPF